MLRRLGGAAVGSSYQLEGWGVREGRVGNYNNVEMKRRWRQTSAAETLLAGAGVLGVGGRYSVKLDLPGLPQERTAASGRQQQCWSEVHRNSEAGRSGPVCLLEPHSLSPVTDTDRKPADRAQMWLGNPRPSNVTEQKTEDGFGPEGQ